MDAAAIALIALVVFGWGVFSARLSRADLGAPIVFVAVGLLLSEWLQFTEPDVSHEAVKVIAEVTLVWVLFSDAARVGLRDLRADLGLDTRLLAVGLPLTIAAGSLLAMWMFGGIGGWMALLVGAALAPTDAALGAAVMTDPAVPSRVRRVLNVESGLNDGIATPVVTVAIAGAAAAIGAEGLPSVGGALMDLVIGLGVGVVAGVIGGMAMRMARRREWASEDLAGPGVLALAVATYAGTLWLSGNGFVAAFVAGLAFGNTAGRGGTREVFYVEQTAGLVSLITWLLFGFVAVPTVLEQADLAIVGYAILSLTVVRMLPVALALVGTGMSPPTVAFIGWFGPRGLASIIFALLALEDLGASADHAVAIIGMTVLLSVLAHGLSAKPLAARYGASPASSTVPPEAPGLNQPSVRGLVRRHPSPAATATRPPTDGPVAP